MFQNAFERQPVPFQFTNNQPGRPINALERFQKLYQPATPELQGNVFQQFSSEGAFPSLFSDFPKFPPTAPVTSYLGKSGPQ
jgi:hypothetical protein